MLKFVRITLFCLICIALPASIVKAQKLARKPPGEIDREAPDVKELIRIEHHNIEVRKREQKAKRIYADMDLIALEKKKLKQFRRWDSRQAYRRSKIALAIYKHHLNEDRKR